MAHTIVCQCAELIFSFLRMVDIITSTKNQFIKLAKSLSNKKFRNETGLFLVEGGNIIKDMPKDVEIEFVLCVEQRLDEVSSFIARGVKVYQVSEELIGYVSDTVTPYGIVAVCHIPNREFCAPFGNALLLDRVQDPGNLGTIFRTAAACGFEDIYLLDTADVYSPKVVRSTLGGLFKVRAYEIDEDTALKLCKECNSAVLDMNGDNILSNRVDSPILFVVGNEAHGVSTALKSACKKTYSLPMKNDIESLNVAVATAVAMYQTI